MRLFSTLAAAFILTIHTSYAQQYGWQVIARPSTIGLAAIVFTDTLNGVIAGGAAGFYVTTDGGQTWVASTGATFATRALSMADSQNGWASGNSGSFGRINHTTDGGISWSDQRSVLGQQYNGTAAKSQLLNTTTGEKASGPDTGLIVQTTNAGITWQEQRLAPTTRLGKVVFVDSIHGWIASLPGVTPGPLLRTNDGGTTWQQLPMTRNFATIEFLDTLRGWAMAFEHPSFYRTTDGGTTWDSLYRLPGNFYGNDLSFTDTLYGWAFGWGVYQGSITEVIYHTTDGGVLWYQESIGLTDDLGTLSDGTMLDRTHGWTVAGDGRVLAYKLVTSVVERLSDQPVGFALRQNYPNPFNPATTMEYEIPMRTHVVFKVFDNLGKEIRTLVNITQEPGVYRVKFDGSGLASGTYFCCIEAGRFQESKQMILLK